MFSVPIVEITARLLIAGLAAWAIARLWVRGVAFVWASGLDPRRQLAHVSAPLRLLLGVAVAAIAAGALRVEGSTATLTLATVTLLVGLITAPVLRDVLGGLALSLARPFTVGDQIATPTISGRVVALGLTRLRLRTPDGALVELPNRVLLADQVTLGPGRRRALPISTTIELPAGADLERASDLLREQAYLSAYVDAGAPVICELIDAATAIIRATPRHPDDSDELRGDLTARAAGVWGRVPPGS